MIACLEYYLNILKIYHQIFDLHPNCRYIKNSGRSKKSNNSQNLRTAEGTPILYLSAPISTEASAATVFFCYFNRDCNIYCLLDMQDLLSLMFTLTLNLQHFNVAHKKADFNHLLKILKSIILMIYSTSKIASFHINCTYNQAPKDEYIH